METMETNVAVYLCNASRPTFKMGIFIPASRDPEEYVDEFLDGILNEDLRYNCEWEFIGPVPIYKQPCQERLVVEFRF